MMRRYRVSGRDMFSYGYKYGEPWAEDRRALERAFREADGSHGRSESAWSASTTAHERRNYNTDRSTGSYRGDKGQNEGAMEVVRVGSHSPSSSRSHGQKFPGSLPTAAVRALPVNPSDIYDYGSTARTFVGGGSGCEDYNSPHMGNTYGSRGLTAQRPPPSAYVPASSTRTWRSESPYGYDHHDRSVSSPKQHLEEGMLYGLGPASNIYSPQGDRYMHHGEYGSHGHPATSAYTQDSSTLVSGYDSEELGSDSESRYSGYLSTGYVESSYLGSDYEEDTGTYLSDGESYDSRSIDEGTYDDKSSDGIYSGGSDSEYSIDDDGYSD